MDSSSSVPLKRTWAGSISGLGGSSSYGVWKVAIDTYYWDRLEQAFVLAIELGVSSPVHEWWYRLIEAEALTREQSRTVSVDDLISLEYVPEEVSHSAQIANDITQACEEVRSRFKWPEGAKTMISVLAEETDAPWTVGRAGYMMDKYPYDKICVPRSSTHVSNQFQSVIRHEYAHVMVLNLSQGNAATYLHEAVTTLAEDTDRRFDWVKLASGAEPWLDSRALNAAFDDRHDPSRFEARSLAYSQSAAIGNYLKSISGEAQIGDLLRAFADNSNWTEIKMNLTGQTPADEALRQVYGFGEQDLFTKTLTWLKAK